MFGNSVSWCIAFIISTKSCVTYDFAFNLKSVLPNLSSSLITKPVQALRDTPRTAVNLLQRANPLFYLIASNPLQNFKGGLNTLYTKDNVLTSPHTPSRRVVGTKLPYIQSTTFTTSFPYDKHKDSTESTSTEISTDIDHFMQVSEQLDRKFYQVSFHKLSSISPTERRENGISFAQSGLLLYLELVALCTESDTETALEIKQSLGLNTTCAAQIDILKQIISSLPKSSNFMKFRWSSRLVLAPQVRISEKFIELIAPALHVHLDHLNITHNTGELTKYLNHMIDADSGWAMQDTFEEEELSNGVCAAWLTTMYVRARWRSAPTVLNDTWLFYDSANPPRPVRMIRINDIMGYVHLKDWDAEAIEIRYSTPDLTFMILLPRGRSLRNLSEMVSANNMYNVYKKMQRKRIAVVLPIYTLRMTLLLPGKLKMMGISRLINSQSGAGCQSLQLSHSVQRIMFWAEAGRNAFKDDGIEWDETPELEKVVDRPYIFFVRWKNITLLNGNFVL